VFNATFCNISAISWRPVLVVEEAGGADVILFYYVPNQNKVFLSYLNRGRH
jgi:hypothetical protein